MHRTRGNGYPHPANNFEVTFVLVSIPGYGSIGASSVRSSASARARPCLHHGRASLSSVQGMHGVVCDDEDGAVVHLPDLLVSKVHQVDMKDIARFPESLCQKRIVGMYSCPIFTETTTPSDLSVCMHRTSSSDDGVIFTDPGLFHHSWRQWARSHRSPRLRSAGRPPGTSQGGSPHIDSSHNITPASSGPAQISWRVVTQNPFSLAAIHGWQRVSFHRWVSPIRRPACTSRSSTYAASRSAIDAMARGVLPPCD